MKIHQIFLIIIIFLANLFSIKAICFESIDPKKTAVHQEIYDERLEGKAIPTPQVGIITKLEGPSFIKRAQELIGHCVGHCLTEKDWNRTAFGMKIFEQDLVYTDNDGRVQIQFDINKTNVKLSKSTEAFFERANPESFILKMNKGGLHFQSQAKDKFFFFLIKTVHGFVRGSGNSEIYVLQSKDVGEITIRVVSGTVDVISAVSNAKTRISEQQTVKIRTSGLVDLL